MWWTAKETQLSWPAVRWADIVTLTLSKMLTLTLSKNGDIDNLDNGEDNRHTMTSVFHMTGRMVMAMLTSTPTAETFHDFYMTHWQHQHCEGQQTQ